MIIKTDYEEEVNDTSHYIEGVPRVSDVVSFIFPFEWEWKDRYLNWLWINKIDQDDYLTEAQVVWTFVHKQVENFIKWKDFDRDHPFINIHSNEIQHWASFVLRELMWEHELHTEQYILDDKYRYQWTCDLVRIDEVNKRVWIYDWKTWWIAKKRWNLPNNYKKPYDKIKKVALQLSLYAEYYRKQGYDVMGLYVVWLHTTWAYPFELDIYSKEEIDDILGKWKELLPTPPSNILLHLDRENMQVRVNTNIGWIAYTNAEIILEREDCEWLTFEEKIEEAIKLQKFLVSKYQE